MNPTMAPFELIFTGDPAVNPDASDVTKYILTGDPAHLALTGKPIRYNLRPLSRRERDYVVAEEGAESNAAVRGYATLSIALVSVEGPDGEPLLSADRVARLKRLRGGITMIPHDDKVWEDEAVFPPGSVVEVGYLGFLRSFR